MLTLNRHNQFEESITNARVVVGSQWMYASVNEQLKKLHLLFAFSIVGSPVILLFGFWVKKKRKVIEKQMRVRVMKTEIHSLFILMI